MAEQSWTYSDWVTYETGNATRLSQLRLHIKEVSDRLTEGNFSDDKGSHDYSMLQSYLESLRKQERIEADAVGTNRRQFTRGKARPL